MLLTATAMIGTAVVGAFLWLLPVWGDKDEKDDQDDKTLPDSPESPDPTTEEVEYEVLQWNKFKSELKPPFGLPSKKTTAGDGYSPPSPVYEPYTPPGSPGPQPEVKVADKRADRQPKPETEMNKILETHCEPTKERSFLGFSPTKNSVAQTRETCAAKGDVPTSPSAKQLEPKSVDKDNQNIPVQISDRAQERKNDCVKVRHQKEVPFHSGTTGKDLDRITKVNSEGPKGPNGGQPRWQNRWRNWSDSAYQNFGSTTTRENRKRRNNGGNTVPVKSSKREDPRRASKKEDSGRYSQVSIAAKAKTAAQDNTYKISQTATEITSDKYAGLLLPDMEKGTAGQLEVSTGPVYFNVKSNMVNVADQGVTEGEVDKSFKVNGWGRTKEVERTTFYTYFENVKYLQFSQVIVNLKSLEIKSKVKSGEFEKSREFFGNIGLRSRLVPIIAQVAQFTLPEQLNYLVFLEFLVDWFMAEVFNSRNVFHILMGLRYITVCKGKSRYTLEEELTFLALKEIEVQQGKGWFAKQLYQLWEISPEEVKEINLRMEQIELHSCRCEMHDMFPIPGPHYNKPVITPLGQELLHRGNTGSDWDTKSMFDYRYAQKVAYQMAMYNWDIPVPNNYTLREEEITDLAMHDTFLPGFDERCRSQLEWLLQLHHPRWGTHQIERTLQWFSDVKCKHCPCRYHLLLRKEWKPECITLPMEWPMGQRLMIENAGGHRTGLFWLKRFTLQYGVDSYRAHTWDNFNWGNYVKCSREHTLEVKNQRKVLALPSSEVASTSSAIVIEPISDEESDQNPKSTGLNPEAKPFVGKRPEMLVPTIKEEVEMWASEGSCRFCTSGAHAVMGKEVKELCTKCFQSHLRGTGARVQESRGSMGFDPEQGCRFCLRDKNEVITSLEVKELCSKCFLLYINSRSPKVQVTEDKTSKMDELD